MNTWAKQISLRDVSHIYVRKTIRSLNHNEIVFVRSDSFFLILNCLDCALETAYVIINVYLQISLKSPCFSWFVWVYAMLDFDFLSLWSVSPLLYSCHFEDYEASLLKQIKHCVNYLAAHRLSKWETKVFSNLSHIPCQTQKELIRYNFFIFCVGCLFRM